MAVLGCTVHVLDPIDFVEEQIVVRLVMVDDPRFCFTLLHADNAHHRICCFLLAINVRQTHHQAPVALDVLPSLTANVACGFNRVKFTARGTQLLLSMA
jgi:hypothetical protein